MLDDCDLHDTMLVPSLDMSACALQYVACVRRGDCSDPRNVPRPHAFEGAAAWRNLQRWKQGDSLCPTALSQPRLNAAIQLQQTLAAALFSPAVLRERNAVQRHLVFGRPSTDRADRQLGDAMEGKGKSKGKQASLRP